MRKLLTFLFLLLSCFTFAQHNNHHVHQRAIEFPDIPSYHTMICDFHIHTVFSDGSVWPNIRIQEALRDSVDAVSMTEHLEYQPHRADIAHPDRNRSYEVAEQAARPYDLIVVNGAEITRFLPPGHSNAIFIKDANKLMIEDSVEVFREANRQGAFTFWNHPNWIAQQRDGIAKLTPMHRYLIKEGLLHGIEVINDLTFSEEALQIALDHDLTIMATSDIHGLVDWQYNIPEGGHRPVTLVFAKEKTADGIKEGLMNRRTVGWFNNTLVGREDVLLPLIDACLTVVKTQYQGISAVLDLTIENNSDVEFILANQSDYSFHANTDIVIIHPNTTTTLQVKTLEQVKDLSLKFKVLNAVSAPKTHPDIVIPIQILDE